MLQNASQKYGIPTSILYPIVMTESGGNTNAHTVTSSEDSRGLFQVNIMSNMDANSSQLFNPSYNINYQVPKLVSTYDSGLAKGLTGSALAQYVEQFGQRPQWTSTVANNISAYYNQFMSASTFSGVDILKLSDYPASQSNTPATDTTPKYFPGAGVQEINPATGDNTTKSNGNGIDILSGVSSMFDTVMSGVKFGAIYLVLFIVFIFALYIVFVNKGGQESE